MKQPVLLFIAFLGTQVLASAQNSEYVKAMEEVVTKIQAAPITEDLTPYANQLERMAAAESKEWLPAYWAAYCYTLRSLSETDSDKKDAVLEKAEQWLANAEKRLPNNDEIEVMKATVAGARLAIDPPNRWQKYGQLSEEVLAAAKKSTPKTHESNYWKGKAFFTLPKTTAEVKRKQNSF